MIDDVIEDQQMILVELGERTFEGEFAARDLQALDEIAGAHEQHAPSVLDEREPDGCREMALAAAGRAEQQEIGASAETEPPAAMPANCGPFGGCQEIAAFARMRGGAGRTRTSIQIVMGENPSCG
jgi:hypothetical protein